MANTILLTGGKGFIGKNIQQSYLASSYTILAPERSELELSDSNAVDKYLATTGQHIECILHAANVGGMRNSSISEEECLHSNIMAFRNLFQHRNKVKKFINFGSGAEYSKPFHKANMTESDIGIHIPQDAYGLSKFLCSRTIDSDCMGRSVNLKIFGIFGPYEDYRVRFISDAIIRSLLDLPIVVNQNAEFDYLYVKDFIKILEYFIKYDSPHSNYNIISGTTVTLVKLAKIVKDLTQNRHAILIKNGDINQSYTGNNVRLLSFLPQDFKFTPIHEAILELIDWYKDNLDSITTKFAYN